MSSILLLHGALNSSSQFDVLKTKLDKSHTIHLLNFSGHGGNLMPLNGLNFDLFVNDILNYLDQNNIEKINLFGYSMGGYAALMFANKYPERVDKIFTCSVKLKWDLESAAKETEFLNPEKIVEKVPAFANNLMMLHGINVWKNLLKSTSNMMMDLAKGQLLTDEDFAKFNHPILFALGDRDTTASLTDTIAVFKNVKNSQLLVLPNSPHEFTKLDLDSITHQINLFF
ncbi:MAG: alpha/beta fold hydrolase [Bacteroidia bacterium]